MTSFNITSGTSTSAQTLTEDDTTSNPASDDTGTVASGAALTVNGAIAVTLNLSAAPSGNGGTGFAYGASTATGAGQGVVINNAGTISTTGGTRVIDATSTANGGTTTATGAEVTLNNSGTISSSGAGTEGDLFRVNYDMPSGIVNVYNTGTMSAQVAVNDAQDVDLRKVYTAKSILIDNGINASGGMNASATMVTYDGDAVRPGGVDPGGTAANIGSAVVNNDGTISAHEDTTSQLTTLSAVNGVDISSGQSATVTNMSGANISGDESGLGSDAGNGSTSATPVTFAPNYTVNNAGTITGYNGDGVASYVAGAGGTFVGTATITNSGTIQGEATGVFDNDGLGSTASTGKVTTATGVGVLAGGNVSITNNSGGLIQGTGAIAPAGSTPATSYGVNAGGGTIVNNAGATIQDTAGQAIKFSDVTGTTNTIANYGTISGSNGKAISFGAGTDTLNLYAGENLTGTVTTGAGTGTIDTLNLASNGTNTTGAITGISGFTTLNVNSGTWTVSDNETYTGGENLAAGATLDLGAAGSTSAVNFGGSSSGTATLDLSTAAQPGNGGTFGGTLANFGDDSRLELSGITYSALDSASVNNNTLFVTDGRTLNTEEFTLSGTHASNYYVHDAGANGIAIDDVACYCTGTLIRAVRDGVAVDVAVEDLAIGDRVVTASGAHRPVKWIGTRAYAGRFANANPDVLPIRVQASALADNVPTRDLHLSPKHALFLDGVLVPVEHLVNGVTIIRAKRVESVTYWHVELDCHDVILAEGAPAESFVDDNSRGIFHNAREFAALYPGETGREAVYCAPRVEHGHALLVIRRRLAERAGLRVSPERRLGVLRGLIEGCDGVRVWGWAQSEAYPDAPVCLEVVVDGVTVALASAERFRSDLAAAGIGEGRHGFDVVLPRPLRSPGSVPAAAVAVRRATDGAALAASMRMERRAEVA